MTKKTSLSVSFVALTLALAAASGCSSIRKGTSSEEIAAQGPTILDTRTNPGTFELNQSLQPMQQPQVVAEVKDFNARINDVRLRFVHVPLEIPMRNIGGSTWQAVLTQEQLRQLAVGGQTMNYQANVIARDENGLMATSKDPVSIQVKAPDLAQAQTQPHSG